MKGLLGGPLSVVGLEPWHLPPRPLNLALSVCHRHHCHHPSLLHSFIPGSKPAFSTNPSHLNTFSTLDCLHDHGTGPDLHVYACRFITRHSLVRAKGEVQFYCIYVCFLYVFCQRFLDDPRADSRQILHAGVLWFRMSSPLLGVSGPPGAENGGNEIFVTIGVNGEFFCILVHGF